MKSQLKIVEIWKCTGWTFPFLNDFIARIPNEQSALPKDPDQCSVGKAQNDKTLLKIKGCLITPFWYSDEINDNPIISEKPSKECLSSHVQDFNTGVINRGDYKIKDFWVAANLFLLQSRTWYHVQNYLQCILFLVFLFPFQLPMLLHWGRRHRH